MPSFALAIRPKPLSFAALVFGAVCASLGAGCGGTSAEEVDRSMHEFRLAATLRTEGSLPGAMQHLRNALELDPENARAHLLLGYIEMERRAFREAEASLRRGIELLERDEARGSSALAEARNLYGVALYHLRRYPEAIDQLAKSASDVLNAQPHFAYGNLGLAYYETGEYAKAIEALGESVRREPRFCLGYFRLGQAYFARDEFGSAEEALTRAIEADSRCTEHFQDAWKLRGETRARLGHRDDAISDFERCVEISARTELGQACRRLLEGTP